MQGKSIKLSEKINKTISVRPQRRQRVLKQDTLNEKKEKMVNLFAHY